METCPESLGDDNSSDVKKVVLNPLIMSIVFGYLPTDQVKECRLVCRAWEEVGTPMLGKRALLSLTKLMLGKDELDMDIPEVSKQLCQRIKIFYEYPYENEDDDWDIVDSPFLSFLPENLNNIEEMNFQIDRYFFLTLIIGLNTNKFQNLKKISIVESLHDMDLDDDDIEIESDRLRRLNLREMETIKTISITRSEYRTGGYAHCIFQQIISKSPNLERLLIQANFYPELSSCTKLKYLKWMGYPLNHLQNRDDEDDREDYDMPTLIVELREDYKLEKLLQMLEEVKDTLEELVMDASVYRYHGNKNTPELNGGDMKFPLMAKLTKLDVRESLAFERLLHLNSSKCLPSLKEVSFQMAYLPAFSLVKLFNRLNECMTCFPNVLDLHINQKIDEDLPFEKIVAVFPNLKKLSVCIMEREWNLLKNRKKCHSDYDNYYHFVNVLDKFASLRFRNLDNLTLFIDAGCTLTELMRALVLITGGLKDLKNLKIVGSDLLTDDECTNFEKVFLALRSITFDGVWWKRKTLSVMENFIRHHDLNVNFIH